MTAIKIDTDLKSFYDYKKFAILYVDDEEKSLKYFSRAFQDQFRIFTASNAPDGLKIMHAHNVPELGRRLVRVQSPCL